MGRAEGQGEGGGVNCGNEGEGSWGRDLP